MSDSDTSRVDAVCETVMATPECRGVIDFARAMERELSTLRAKLEEAEISRELWRGTAQGNNDMAEQIACERDQLAAKLAEAEARYHKMDHEWSEEFDGLRQKLAEATRPESEQVSYNEADGCPTETAVLKREWRTLTAALTSSEAGAAAMQDALERVKFYYAGWNPEQPLPPDWPKRPAGDPMSPKEIVNAALSSTAGQAK